MGKKVAVRLNPWRSGQTEVDLDACIYPGVDIVKATKVEDPTDISRIDGIISYLECKRGLPVGSVKLMPEIDSAYGILELEAIVKASSRTECVQFGGGDDFCNSIGVDSSDDRIESEWARQYIVMVSSKLGLEPPFHGSLVSLHAPELRAKNLRRAFQLGYQGASCIHPNQVEITNEIFTIAPERVEWARRVIEAYTEAEQQGLGVIVLEGKFLDEAHLRGARKLLKRIAADDVPDEEVAT